MPGVPGAGGPPPKRASQRRRTNKPAVPVDTAETPGVVRPPAPGRDWHPSMKSWYVSLGRSGQARFYTASDWSTAWAAAEVMSRELNPQPVVTKDGEVLMLSMPVKAATLAAWLKACTVLMATEGDRRRLRLELERPAGEEAKADVSELDEFRQRLRSG
jgi:hypothetical protein